VKILVGVKRAADASFAVRVKPDGSSVEFYIAIGISGAIQHLAGMRGSRVIVAALQAAL
jgi:hypothetical protein